MRVEPGDRLGDDARNAATALSARVLHGRAEHRHRGRRPRAARRGGVVADSETTRRNGRRSLARTGRLARGSTARGERRGTRARASALEDRATRTRAKRRDVRRARDRDSRRRRRARVSEIGGKRGPRMRIRIVSYEKTVSLMRTRKSPGAIMIHRLLFCVSPGHEVEECGRLGVALSPRRSALSPPRAARDRSSSVAATAAAALRSGAMGTTFHVPIAPSAKNSASTAASLSTYAMAKR